MTCILYLFINTLYYCLFLVISTREISNQNHQQREFQYVDIDHEIQILEEED